MSDLWFVLRVVDVFLYCGIVSGVVMHWGYLGRLDERLPQFRWGLLLLIVALTYGVIELVFRQQPGGPRLVPLTVALLVVFRSCYLLRVRHLFDVLRARKVRTP